MTFRRLGASSVGLAAWCLAVLIVSGSGSPVPSVRAQGPDLGTDAQREAGFPTEQTILFGFSQGCLMVLEAGLRYPHRFAGVIGISVPPIIACLKYSA